VYNFCVYIYPMAVARVYTILFYTPTELGGSIFYQYISLSF